MHKKSDRRIVYTRLNRRSFFMFKQKKIERGAIKSILIGVFIHSLCLIALSAAAALIMTLCKNPLGLIPAVSLTLVPLSAISASIILMHTDGRGSVRMLSALFFVLITLAVSTLMRSVGVSVFISHLCYLLASAVSLLLPKRAHKRGRRRRSR